MTEQFLERQAKAWHEYLGRFDDHGSESYSGWGSNLEFTTAVRAWLPEVIKRYNIKTMLDAPCGDLAWLQHVDLGDVLYMGWDVEPFIIERNRERFPERFFSCENLLTFDTSYCAVDLILCRDFLFHLPNFYIRRVLNKFKASGSKYLIVTNHPGASNDRDCPLDGGEDGILGYYCQSVDLEAEPFNLQGRVESVSEDRDAPQELVLFRL